jgi:putative pyruvate formate lyase activating enzyme
LQVFFDLSNLNSKTTNFYPSPVASLTKGIEYHTIGPAEEKMKRRKFLKHSFHLVLSGVGVSVLSTNARCKEKSTGFKPSYLKLYKNGELKKRGKELWARMESCDLCPRQCLVNRLSGKEGFCQSSSQLEVSSFQRHFGEERPLVGRGGSGTIFFTNCGLRCVFCINWEINHKGMGDHRSIKELAQMMIRLQDMGCPNINVVTPTQYSPHIALAVNEAAALGLNIPIVYNTHGWERLDVLKYLDGIVDIYLPDFKYFEGTMSAKYSSGADTYPEVTKAALVEMNRQVGVAKPAANGLMQRGLMIRHLVMPNNVGGTQKVVQWIAQNLPKDTYLNLMSQYRPMYKANQYPKIDRKLTRAEYKNAVKWAKEAGLTNLDIQGSRWL